LAFFHYIFPNCKIIFVLPSTGAVPPALSTSPATYQGPTYYAPKFKEKIIALNKLYVSELSSYTNLKFAPVFLNIDRVYGHGKTDVQASSRITTVESIASNFIHPAAEGMQQIGDCIYATIKSFM